ncbi:hypothetical protein HID58_052646 [Brassica napus]|uniref:Uncharacterized protein n=1 Tax=Brassica napus TaxID=3708 RepID=A0ABQ8ACF6_BRANA|nr:hypothetical protein HID58_052646 [Brassica napus]
MSFGGPPSYPDLVRKTHTRKDRTFMNEQAEALVLEVEQATDLKEEMTKSQSTRFYNFYRLKLPPLQHNQTPAQRQG